MVKLLLEKGADVFIADKDGRTPLHTASAKGNLGIIKIIIAHDNANLNFSDNNGRTALSWAASKGYNEVIELFLKNAGMDINLQDKYSYTPLTWALQKLHESAVCLLFRYGRSISSIDRYSLTFQAATFISDARLEELLRIANLENDDDLFGLRALF